MKALDWVGIDNRNGKDTASDRYQKFFPVHSVCGDLLQVFMGHQSRDIRAEFFHRIFQRPSRISWIPVPPARNSPRRKKADGQVSREIPDHQITVDTAVLSGLIFISVPDAFGRILGTACQDKNTYAQTLFQYCNQLSSQRNVLHTQIRYPGIYSRSS